MSKANVIRWLTVLVSVAIAGISSAAPPDEELARAKRLYMTGDFMAAARIAESVPSVRGQTLAARAMLAHAAYVAPPAQRLERYREAARLARTAIDYDAEKAEAYRYLVIALGHVARDRSLLVAHFEGYADEGRHLIDRAMALEPQSPWGHAVLGAWHTEVVTVAGAALARYLYDASAERAKVAFETAIRLEPDNPVLRFEYAQALVRLGGPGSAAAARKQLAAVVEMTPRDAVETIVTSRARRALEAGSAEVGEKTPREAIWNTGDEHP